MNGVQIGWRIRAAKQSTLDAMRTIEDIDGKDSEPILAELDRALTALRKAEAAAILLTQRDLTERRREGDRRTGK